MTRQDANGRRRNRCTRGACAVLVSSMAILAAAAAEPPPHTGDARPENCPGRRAHAASPTSAPAEAPPLVRRWIGPYGTVWGYSDRRRTTPTAHLAARDGYRAQVFHMVDCAENPVGDRFPGLDDLVALMGHEGVKLYRSPSTAIDAGPDGIIGADDVVVIKINYQWTDRGSTNVDLLRGLVRRIVDHPDGFTGEIAICENAQFASIGNFDREQNNAQDIALSPHDVVAWFAGQGVTISHNDWGAIREVTADEYDAGDPHDGYVLYAYDAGLNGRVSYPKFQTGAGTLISLKHGIWDSAGGTYDRDRLKFINVPVLKSHSAAYGVTACVKNYMGVVSGALGTNSHYAIANGLLGALLGEIRPADLNILDCTWVNGHPHSGPWTSYAEASRRNELVASTDPVAADRWAATHVLIPAFLANGYMPPWPGPSADPDDAGSAFRNYLDNSMDRIIAAGFDATNDAARIDAFTWSGAGDLDLDGAGDLVDNCPYDANPEQDDCDGDGIGDVCAIREGLSPDANGNGVPDPCECPGDLDGSGTVGFTDLFAMISAWGPCTDCPVDLDGNGTVGFSDLTVLLAAWGPCG